MYIDVSNDGSVAVAVGETEVIIAKFVGLEKDLSTIMPIDGVNCTTTPEINNCRFIGGSSEMTMTCTVTPRSETDGGMKVFKVLNSNRTLAVVTGKIVPQY